MSSLPKLLIPLVAAWTVDTVLSGSILLDLFTCREEVFLEAFTALLDCHPAPVAPVPLLTLLHHVTVPPIVTLSSHDNLLMEEDETTKPEKEETHAQLASLLQRRVICVLDLAKAKPAVFPLSVWISALTPMMTRETIPRLTLRSVLLAQTLYEHVPVSVLSVRQEFETALSSWLDTLLARQLYHESDGVLWTGVMKILQRCDVSFAVTVLMRHPEDLPPSWLLQVLHETNTKEQMGEDAETPAALSELAQAYRTHVGACPERWDACDPLVIASLGIVKVDPHEDQTRVDDSEDNNHAGKDTSEEKDPDAMKEEKEPRAMMDRE